MKIYISAGFNERERLRAHRDVLWSLGHDVVSSWLDECKQPEGMTHETFYKKLAVKDVAEVFSADLVIVDFIGPTTSGGRDVEYGVALGRHQRTQLWIVGHPERRSPFHELADAEFADWNAAFTHLGSRAKEPSPRTGTIGLLSTSPYGGLASVPGGFNSASPIGADTLGQDEIDGSRGLHNASPFGTWHRRY